MMGFLGYPRGDGRVGVRNHVVVMSSVSCANAVVEHIGRAVPEVKTITHTEGCGRGPADVSTTLRTLANIAAHPNVAAVLLVGLGCEVIKAELIASRAGEGKRVEWIGIQQCAGSPKAVARGIEIAHQLIDEASEHERREFGFEHLTLAMECGGSDSFSGLTANPSVGFAADWLVAQGGTVILSEVTEFLGTEAIVAERCATEEVKQKLLGLLADHDKTVKRHLGPLAHTVIAPGNQAGGLSSIQEKSLGCIKKGGTSPIQEVVDYAEPPTTHGLCVMDAPGSDIFSITGMIAGGAQIVLFTTGRGSPAGSPIAPVVKVASNTRLFEWMPDDMDFDAGRMMTGMSLEDCGNDLVETVKGVANGEQTAPERTQTELFAIHTVGPAF
jgi:altronate dehydratase large subunit